MLPRVIGMVHLEALPGSPHFGQDLKAVIARALADAERLQAAHFDALMIENFGDVPFFVDDVPKVTIAAMTRVVSAISRHVDFPFGVNVLRNDALGALAIAASFIRVNVLSGLMYTDQGPIVGRAAEVLRARQELAPGVAIMADVFVKHASAPPGSTIARAAADLVERGGADAVIVSGVGTGRPPAMGDLKIVRQARRGEVPLLVGSGADSSNVLNLLAHADGVIAGTPLKVGAVASGPVDPEQGALFVAAAREALG